jgi:hypothetical protein
MMGSIVYLLCAFTSWICAVLLLRAYATQRTRLLFWSGAAFCAFGASNVFLFIDLVVVTTRDLSLLRSGLTLVGVCLLLWGLIWERPAR